MGIVPGNVAGGKVPGPNEPGVASHFIYHLPSILQSGMLAVLYIRESSRGQRRNLHDQEASCRKQLAELGMPIAKVFYGVESGWRWQGQSDRQFLAGAIAYAQELQAKDTPVVVVAESTSRFIRARGYGRANQSQQPSQEEFGCLATMAGGMPLATLLPPDTEWQEERGRQSERGFPDKQKKARHRKPSRGSKKSRRMILKPKALRLRHQGVSMGKIAKRLGVSKATVQYWIDHP